MLIDLFKQIICALWTSGEHWHKYETDYSDDKFVNNWGSKEEAKRVCKICGYTEVSVTIDTFRDGITSGWINKKYQPLTKEKIIKHANY